MLAIDEDALDVLVADAKVRETLVRRERGADFARDRPLGLLRRLYRRMTGGRGAFFNNSSIFSSFINLFHFG